MAVAFLYVLYCCGILGTPIRVLTIFAAIVFCSILGLQALRVTEAYMVAFLLLLILLVQKITTTVKPEIDIYVKFCGRHANLQKFPNEWSYKSYNMLR